MSEVAERISTAAGRTIVHVDVPLGDWVAAAVNSGLPADYVDLLAGLFTAMRAGHGAATTEDVAAVTGRPAQAFDDWARLVSSSVWARTGA